MSPQVSEQPSIAFTVYSTQLDATLEAQVSVGLPASRVGATEDAWSAARQQLALMLASEGQPCDHSHWNWRTFLTNPHLYFIGVEVEGEIQALMAVQRQLAPSRILTRDGRILYVSLLEAAPWNLPCQTRPRQFGALAEPLFRIAGCLSRLLGADGLVGLQSLPQAEGFYLACGFLPYYGSVAHRPVGALQYFERQF